MKTKSVKEFHELSTMIIKINYELLEKFYFSFLKSYSALRNFFSKKFDQN